VTDAPAAAGARPRRPLWKILAAVLLFLFAAAAGGVVVFF
jgi:uncharacterized membrane protein YcjF (UPF0283 family)